MTTDYRRALEEIGTVLDRLDEPSVERACAHIAKANRIGLYGCGREALQIKGFAMRLYHLGLKVGVVGDMTMPPLGKGDLFIASAGPGELSTVTALMQQARKTHADILLLTAEPDAPCASRATQVLHIPAQTMARDRTAAASPILPMGSAYEGSLFFLFEVMIGRLKRILNVSTDAMRANHTNME